MFSRIEGIPNPSDMKALPTFMDKLLTKYDGKINRLVANSGYESEENYLYLKEKQIKAFINPPNYEIKKKRKYKKDVTLCYKYIILDGDYYFCHNSKKLEFEKVIYRKNKGGFKS